MKINNKAFSLPEIVITLSIMMIMLSYGAFGINNFIFPDFQSNSLVENEELNTTLTKLEYQKVENLIDNYSIILDTKSVNSPLLIQTARTNEDNNQEILTQTIKFGENDKLSTINVIELVDNEGQLRQNNLNTSTNPIIKISYNSEGTVNIKYKDGTDEVKNLIKLGDIKFVIDRGKDMYSYKIY